MSQTSVMRIIDASLNRAAEGLRVAEDYVRFVLDDPFLTGQMKGLRHDLADAAATISSIDRHAARETQRDVGAAISTDAEAARDDVWAVCAASFKRAEQSLRSLEEYGKLIDGEFAGRMESLRYRLYTLEKAVDVGRSSRERLDGVRLCVLVDGRASARDFEKLVRELVAAGVGMIQFRDKQLDDRELVERARLLVELTRGSRTLSVINDRADIAAAVHADGVHVGQEDLSVKDARAIVGTRLLVGVSTHNIGQARGAVLDGADYLGAGPTFVSRTKSFDAFAGLDYLREVSAEIRLPTFAIGGITAGNVRDVMEAGIGRVAVSGAVVDAADPAVAARDLIGILNEERGDVHPAAQAASPSLASDL
jgi:thiamine-phosphate pyrophosphorylase